MATIPSIKKRRSTVRGSITKLVTRLEALEAKADQPTTYDHAQELTKKLESLDAEFRKHHYELIDLVDETDDATLTREQAILDDHDDLMADLNVRARKLVMVSSASTDSTQRKAMSRRILRLNKTVTSINDSAKTLTSSSDSFLVQQHTERLRDAKTEQRDVSDSLLAMSLPDTDDLCTSLLATEEIILQCDLALKKLSTPSTSSPPTVDSKGVKLPKLEVPTFDGNIVNWHTFWDQFDVSIHRSTTLSDAEKLVYLRSSLKSGTAKGVIEGLSRSGDFYAEAVSSLKARYDRPRLVHQTHVQMILNAPAIKDGTGRELRRLHDIVQQHLRALRALGYDPSGPFITSVLELKLDTNTMFEWQRHSQDTSAVPHYQKLLEFLNLRAQAAEASPAEHKKPPPRPDIRHKSGSRDHLTTFHTNAAVTPASISCPICKVDNHPLATCSQFKVLPHDQKMSALKSRDLCLNCLRPGHYVRQCKSLHRCKKCQKLHHTLLHVDPPDISTPPSIATPQPSVTVTNNSASTLDSGSMSHSLLMTCRVMVHGPDGSSVESRALLDSASSASFVSERLAQCLRLPRSRQNTKIVGIAGISHGSSSHSVTKVIVSPVCDPSRQIHVPAVILPRVTCDLPIQSVPFKSEWTHLSDLTLADPNFSQPDRIDLLLGIDVFVQVVRHGRRFGVPGSPSAFETDFGWVIAGETATNVLHFSIASHHTTVSTGDEILRRFWEVEEQPGDFSKLSTEERAVVEHFEQCHSRSSDGCFIVPLPKKTPAPLIGESRSQAVRRFRSLERSLHFKNQFHELSAVMDEYFKENHAELVPTADLEKPTNKVFYLPLQVVRKESSSTTKLRAVFDASAASSSGTSLNNTLLVGPTVHSSLVSVLLRFRLHCVALTADVSRMYRAVLLDPPDKDLHRFVWRSSPTEPLRDYRMNRITFGVAASSYAANMAIKQNAIDLALQFPLAAEAVHQSLYVDDALTGADSVEDAISLQKQLQELFTRGGFTLCKWNSNNPSVLRHIPTELKDTQTQCTLPDATEYTKTLGIEWNTVTDHFRLTIGSLPPQTTLTKRALISDVSKVFDVFGWFSPCTVKMKIVFQQLWEVKLDWDDVVPDDICELWVRWRRELDLLPNKQIPRCLISKDSQVLSTQLHGFSDASERAYSAVVYIRVECNDGSVQVSLVSSKTKVAPIKRTTIPRLELCGARLLAQLVNHTSSIIKLPPSHIYNWTDSIIVLSWITGNPRRLKTFVGNRVADILECTSPNSWRHVSGTQNPADCASRGLFPSELMDYELWWEGPVWLKLPSSSWPEQSHVQQVTIPEEEKQVSLHTTSSHNEVLPLIPVDKYSNYSRLIRVTAWVRRFVHNCKAKMIKTHTMSSSYLSVRETQEAEFYWFSIVQKQSFISDIVNVNSGRKLHRSSPLLSLHPIVDERGLLRVGGREQRSGRSYSSQHPVIIHGKHTITKLLIRYEHIRLLHCGPTLLSASLNRRVHILGERKAVRSITRACVTCRKIAARPQSQMMGQLPSERVTPDIVFNKVGLDYAGPLLLKLGHTRKPVIVKAYVCVFVSLSVKAVHLELVSDLTTEAFLAGLRRFMSRRGKPAVLWSDHGKNFVGACREITELIEFLDSMKTQKSVSEFCTAQNVEWQFIPPHAPHFGGLWEAAVKSFKTHLRKVVGNVKLSFEEMYTVLTQIEACLNSRPIAPGSGDSGVQILTPGHFLVGRPLESLPDPSQSFQRLPLLKRWYLCQALVRHFWQRWSAEYLISLRRFSKWHHPTRNIAVGDIVLLREDNTMPSTWPMGRITKVHSGQDGLVRTVTVQTTTGEYRRPVVKIVLLLPIDHNSEN